MLSKIRSEIKNLRVTWKGTNRNKTTGKENPTMQTVVVNDDGREESFYIGSQKELDAVKIGDRIDAVVDIRAYKDGLYVNLISYAPVGSGADKKVRV